MSLFLFCFGIFSSYFSLALIIAFVIISKGKTANAIKSGIQQAIHESDVAAHNLQIIKIAESGVQTVHNKQPITYIAEIIFFISSLL